MECITGEISVRLESTSKPLRRKFVSHPIFLRGSLSERNCPLRREPHAELTCVGLTPHEMKDPSAHCSEQKGLALDDQEPESDDGLARRLRPKPHRTWAV